MWRPSPSLLRWLADRPALGVGLAGALFWGAALLGVAALRYGGDLRGHLCLGNQTNLPPALAGAPRNSLWGYDGQYFAILATDPFMLHPETAPRLDNPPYRAGRIGLPLVAWCLALGRPGLAVALYQWLCWLPGVLGLAVVARWLQREGASGWEAWDLAATAHRISRGQPGSESGLQPCYALPVAHASGRDGSQWRTELLLHNWIPGPLPVKIELLRAGSPATEPPVVTLQLAPHEPRTIDDAVFELFSLGGSGALRISPCLKVLDVQSRTVDVTRTLERGDWTPAQLAGRAVTGEHPGRLDLATNGPGTRVNLGLLSLGAEPVSVRVWLEREGRRERLQTTCLGAGELRALLDIVPPHPDGTTTGLSLDVTPATGRVLAYATVVYSDDRPPLHLVPVME